MTVSTLNRRTFFGKLRSPSPVKTEEGKLRRLLVKEMPLPPVSEDDALTIAGSLDPYTGAWTIEQAAHLLRRTGFGVAKADLDLLLGLTPGEAVDYLLANLNPAPAPPINNYQADAPDPVVPEGESWVEAEPYNDVEGYRIESWRGWWHQLMLAQGASIQEKMTMFWHNHFATQTEIVFHAKAVYQHNRLLRENALGNFKDLVRAVTLDGMMLYYLNGYLNHKDFADENYARELQELFTVGKDSVNQYTEDDVVAAARVLTGWRPEYLTNEIYQEADAHDETDKQFSAFYNNTVIAGNADAAVELDALLDMIFAKEEVSVYLVRKLYRWFVYYKMDDTVQQEVILPLAQLFRDSNYDIKPVLEMLLKSEHFFNAANNGCFIKTPVDLVIGSLRSFNTVIPASTFYDEFVMRYILTYFMYEMQMLPGDPPNVAGWQAFRQSPAYYRMWINGDTMRNRNTYTEILSTYFFETDNDQMSFDHIAFASQFEHPEDPTALLEDTLKLLLPQPISNTKKAFLKAILLSGLANDSYWTDAWFFYQQNPDDEMAHDAVWYRLLLLNNYIMKLPEYQLA